MPEHPVASAADWLEARKALLQKEKEFSRVRDELSAARRELPWRELTKEYVFEGTDGQVSLSQLFDDCSQLIVYHFMFDPEWEEGCKSCSLLADHYDPSVIHLRARDVTMVTVARAPLAKLEAFRARMGWKSKWVSSLASDFNRDFHVSFTPDELEQKAAYYNYRDGAGFPVTEAPGISVFAKDESGKVFHTYSSYARGLDLLIGAYNLLDLVPKGRDEEKLSYGMEWVRHRDRYGDGTFVDPYVRKEEPS